MLHLTRARMRVIERRKRKRMGMLVERNR